MPPLKRMSLPPKAASPTAPTAVPTLRHGLPLPVGKVMQATVAPPGMTDMEFSNLTAVGWQPGQQVTPNMRAAITAMQDDAEDAKHTLPVDPATKPVQFNVKDINSLSAEDQTSFLQSLNNPRKAATAAPAARATAQQQAQQPAPRPIAAPPLSEPAKKMAEARQLDVDYGQPDRPARRSTLDEIDQAVREEAAEIPEPPVRVESAAPRMTNCPHCNWQLDMPGIPEPSYEDKMAYLASEQLGDGKPFIKAYALFGGRMQIYFRTLHIRETDACYKQTAIDRQNGEIQSEVDWIERINRYRLYLQLYRLKSENFDRELADGLTPWHNPYSEVWWSQDNHDNILKDVETQIVENVLTSESLCRIAQQHCAMFNRLVSKLDNNVTNDSFWQATDQQPSR